MLKRTLWGALYAAALIGFLDSVRSAPMYLEFS